LIVSIVIVAILVVKAVLFFTAKPKVIVNYVAEYNRITRPVNYDPNDNAATYYQKAFDAFVELPKELQEVPYIIGWVTDFNNTERTLLEKWLVSNTLAFYYFKIAANKPYYWLERHAGKDNNMMSMNLHESFLLRQLIYALTWDAKLAASKGRLETAFENIIDCYKAGRQKCLTPSLLTEQKVGLEIKLDAAYGTMVILDRAQLDSTSLKSFNDALQTEFNNDTYVLDFAADKLFCYDVLQRTFVDNSKGTGRLYWKEAERFPGSTLTFGCYGRWYNLWYEWDGPWYNACPFLYGPTKKETIAQIEQLLKLFEPLKTQTPWQIHKQGYYLEKIEEICNNNFFLRMVAPSPRREFSLYHLVKAKTEALIAIAAILRFKEDNHQFPVSLDELVSNGYLESVPMDPYSDGPLVYKLTGDNFKLYSVGEDFVDDDGATNVRTDGATRRDILFWPIRRLDDIRKKSEKQKAEREAKARKEIEEANQPE